jgi:hydrogenase maturation protease
MDPPMTTPRRTLILGLGNTVLGDDGVGISVVREIRKTWKGSPCVECMEASLGGIVLLDLIAGFDGLVVIDAIMTDDANPPGFVYELGPEDLGDAVRPYASHALDLQTTMALGKRLGRKMPSTVKIFAVKIEDNGIFREGLTPAVDGAVPGLARRVIAEMEEV